MGYLVCVCVAVSWERLGNPRWVIPASFSLRPVEPCPLPRRPTMIKYGINNIRELVGHKVNLQMVYDSPICRLES